jgi:hypothetical protein
MLGTLLATAFLAFIKGTCASLRRGQPTLASFVQDGLKPSKDLTPKDLKPAKPKRDRLIQPFQYDQRMLVCNAYHSELGTPISLTKNGDIIFIEGEALDYHDCRYAKINVKRGDKLDFFTTDNIAGGTFEVTDLPREDAVLLLVLENSKNESYPMVAQSFTFPLRAAGKAQLAVVDTTEKSDKAKLHISKERAHFQTLDSPEQQFPPVDSMDLAFNEVYELEGGNFTLALKAPARKGVRNPAKALELKKDTDYVLLRIAGEKGGDMLVSFPPEQGGAVRTSLSFIMLIAAVLMVNTQ